MAVFSDIAEDALRELGVLAQGEALSADDASGALAAMNRMVDAFAAERLMIFTNTRTLFTITSGQQDYTVGPAGNADVPWPVFPEHVNFEDTAFTPAREFQMMALTNDAWSNIPIKSLQGKYPIWYYFNATFPLATIQLWPVPTSSTLRGVLYAPQQWNEFAGLTTPVSLPPGYRRMLVKNLAMELAPSYSRQTSPELRQQAQESLAVVKRSNTSLQDMSVDAAALVQGQSGRYIYNILTG